MGVIVKYTCKDCGFVADDVFIGPGWISYQEAVLCQDCGSVISRPIDERTKTIQEGYAQCKRCNSNNLVIWDRKCPRCGSTVVDEEAVGMWD